MLIFFLPHRLFLIFARWNELLLNPIILNRKALWLIKENLSQSNCPAFAEILGDFIPYYIWFDIHQRMFFHFRYIQVCKYKRVIRWYFHTLRGWRMNGCYLYTR